MEEGGRISTSHVAILNEHFMKYMINPITVNFLRDFELI